MVLPFNSDGGGPFDTLNLGNLNVHFSIPVLHKAGRGTPFTYDLSFENSLWKPVTSGGTTSWQPSTTFGWSGLGEYQAGTLTSQVTTGSGPCNPPSNMTMQYWTIYYNWVYQDAQGTKHPFSIASSTGGLAGCTVGPPASSTGVATDGSGYTLAASGGSGTLYSAAGKTLNVPVNLAGGSSTTTDTNGNKITTNTSGVITDTLGQTVLTIAGGAPSNLTFTYTPPSGVAKAVTVSYATYTVKTNFACGITEYNVSNVSLVDRVTLLRQLLPVHIRANTWRRDRPGDGAGGTSHAANRRNNHVRIRPVHGRTPRDHLFRRYYRWLDQNRQRSGLDVQKKSNLRESLADQGHNAA